MASRPFSFVKLRQVSGITVEAVLLLLLGSLTSFAQLPTATILGTVKDISGASVPNATVSARNTDTGQIRTITTEADGAYRFSALPVGTYDLRVEHAGFQAQERTGLTLTVEQEAVVNLVLQVGSATQTVSVTTEAPLVNTTSGSLGGLVDPDKIADLPLNGRNYADLTLLQPGIAQSVDVAKGTAYVGTYFSSSGAPVRSNNYLLDGAILTNLWGASSASATSSTLGVDGIQEYKLITNAFTAEYGMTMGSQMVMVSKGGTNQFHGDVFEYLRNSVLDAANYFDTPADSGVGHRLPEFRRNNFGGSVGGPIKKDKSFFYAVFEGVRQQLGVTTNDTTLPAACHQLVNPGTSGTTLLNPSGCGTGLTTKTVVAPAIQPFLALFPLPTLGLANNEFTYPFTEPSTDNYGQMRFDQNLSSKDNFFARYTIQDTFELVPGAYPEFRSDASSRNQFLTLSESHIFSPALLNSARFSFSRTNLYWPPDNLPGVVTSGPQLSLVPGQLVGGITPGNGVTGIGSTGPRGEKQNIFTWSDDLFYSKGRHSLKFGTLVNRFQQVINNGLFNLGSAGFTSIANFMQGTPSTITAPTPGSSYIRDYLFTTLGFYAQDDWRVTSRLTLNLGLRYEISSTPVEAHGRWSTLRNLTDPTFTVSPDLYLNPTLKDFGPRFGFAWDIKGDGKTAVRGGFAELYDLGQSGTLALQSQAGTPPFSNRETASNPTTGFTVPLTFPTNVVIASPRPLEWHMRQPHMLQYNLAVERQLPLDTSISLAYVGSRGINLYQTREGNPTIPQGIPGPGGLCVARPTGQTINLTSLRDGSATACWLGNDPRMNPNFTNFDLFAADANSWYNALQFGLVKRLSKGLQFQSSYTWSKVLDQLATATAGGGELGNQVYNDPDDTYHAERGPAVFDITNVWKFNAIYHLPEFVPSDRLVAKATNGWWLSGILTLQSGLPFTPCLTSNRSVAGVSGSTACVDHPDIVGGRSAGSIVSGVSKGCGTPGISGYVAPGTHLGTANLYFDPCAFTIPNLGFLGTSGYDNLRGPNFRNLDFSLVKDTPLKFLGEAGALEFRAEVFNLTNTPHLALPGRQVYAGNAKIASGAADTASENPVSTAGLIQSTVGNSRQLQFALKLLF